MRAAKTMHMLVKIHHLETIELIRHLLDLLRLALLNLFHARGIPLDVGSWGFLVQSARLDGSARHLAIVDVLDPVVAHGTCFNSCSAHLGCWVGM